MSTTTVGASDGGRRQRLPLVALLTGQGISLLGNTLTGLAVPWFVLETTGSASRTGVVAFAGMLPTVIGGVLGGTVVDRLGHRRTSVLADLASGATVATIPLLHATVGLAFWQLLALVFLGALLDTPGSTARVAILPDLADRAGMPLERANAAGQTIGSVSTLLGPPVAGGLIALLGSSNVLWLDAGSFAVSAGRSRPVAVERDPDQGFVAEVTEGLRLVWADQLLRAILGPAMVINFLFAPLFGVVMPVFAERTYGEAVDLGLMLAGFGAGSLVGSVVYGAVGTEWSRRKTLGGAFLLVGLPFWGLALTPALPVTIGLLMTAGLLLAPINPLVISVIQRRTPEALLGRVIGAVIASTSVLAPLGMLTAGVALEAFGVGVTLVAVAAGLMVVGVRLMLNPVFAELDRPAVGGWGMGDGGWGMGSVGAAGGRLWSPRIMGLVSDEGARERLPCGWLVRLTDHAGRRTTGAREGLPYHRGNAECHS